MSRTILLADDSVTIQKVIELTFMDEDYEVVAVSNGDDALERLQAETPDLVLADVHMPGASGYELARRSKKLHPGVPVVLLVGTFEPFSEEEYRDSGADAHLKKPFDSQELLALVERLLQSRGETPTAEALPGERSAAAGEGEASPAWDVASEPVWANFDAGAPGVAEEGEDLEPSSVAESAVQEASGWEKLDLRPEEEVESPAPRTVAEEETPQEVEGVETASGPGGAGGAPASLSDQDVERIARRVVQLLGSEAVREVAWEVVPDLAEVIIKDRLRELESQVE